MFVLSVGSGFLFVFSSLMNQFNESGIVPLVLFRPISAYNTILVLSLLHTTQFIFNLANTDQSCFRSKSKERRLRYMILPSSQTMSNTTEDEVPGKRRSFVKSTKQSSFQHSLTDIDFGTVSPAPAIGVSISDVQSSRSRFAQPDILLL